MVAAAWLHKFTALAKLSCVSYWLHGGMPLAYTNAYNALVRSDFKTRYTCHAGGGAAVLLYMQQHVRKPLRLLRHDNYATFAEIFTTALLQAAATGETLVGSDQSKDDKVLQKHADKDASKIFRLNQRMQVSGHPRSWLPHPLSPPPWFPCV